MSDDQLDISVQPNRGNAGNWPKDFAIPESLSTGGWTKDDRGYAQQTFLGASIKSFTMNAAFGDQSSSLSVELVEDEFNKSDTEPSGLGDDIYHNGLHDRFAAPFVGAPVFFKFGQHHVTIEQAYKHVFDTFEWSGTMPRATSPSTTESTDDRFRRLGIDRKYTIGEGFVPLADPPADPLEQCDGLPYTDGESVPAGSTISSLEDNEYYDVASRSIVRLDLEDEDIGCQHLTFGGILQSFTKNQSTSANSSYSVRVVDPREILSSVQLILNNYTGTINEVDNIFNIYGFLEYEPDLIDSGGKGKLSSGRDVLTRNVDANGLITYTGSDTHTYDGQSNFPITGTGFSRRVDQGIPYYRVAQGLDALLSYNAELPEEYKEKSFGDKINFRGFKYVVDLSALPPLPDFYYLDFDTISLLDLCLEICDVTNTDLSVTLLPVINHPKVKKLYDRNEEVDTEELVVGIIKVDVIDRSVQPKIGAINEYLQDLSSERVDIKSQDVGYELSNITTEKIIAGGQVVDMHFFEGSLDRDIPQMLKGKAGAKPLDLGQQWLLETSLDQQIIPYYGSLGNNFVSLPRGFGAYQQILLDSSSLFADGVGEYYVATEMELRSCLMSFDKWVQFLLQYNDIYLEQVEDSTPGAIIGPPPTGVLAGMHNTAAEYAVTVPRSVFDNYSGDFDPEKGDTNPPLGWPLYYKRATNIGIPQAGLVTLQMNWQTQLLPNLLEAKKSLSSDDFTILLNSTWDDVRNKLASVGLQGEHQAVNDIIKALQSYLVKPSIKLVEDRISSAIQQTHSSISKYAKKGNDNSKRVYTFLRNIASECLGKKFLVKIPQQVNVNWANDIEADSNLSTDSNNPDITAAPFGFRPLPRNQSIVTEHTQEFKNRYRTLGTKGLSTGSNNVVTMFTRESIDGTTIDGTDTSDYEGALSAHYNPLANDFVFNYEPEAEGGYFPKQLYGDMIPLDEMVKLSNKVNTAYPAVENQLAPIDISNFINQNNRISPYVRFNHSEYLSFEGVNKGDFIQESITPQGNIPDLSFSLDNLQDKSSDPYYFTLNPQAAKDETVAFVKCSVDEAFYYSPPCSGRDISVWGEDVSGIPVITLPSNQVNPKTGKGQTLFPLGGNVFVPSPSGSKISKIVEYAVASKAITKQKTVMKIDTEVGEKELKHAYALITLPVSVKPLKDSRFRDGPFQLNNPEKLKHLLTMDVVKDYPHFSLAHAVAPATPIAGPSGACGPSSPANNTAKVKNVLKSAVNISYSFANQINFTVPSPVYPDLVVLPLMSKQRVYGPWISSRLDDRTEAEKEAGKPITPRYTDLGGAVEFIKEENLSPWNYSGYSTMNEAGKLQARFANNLLLLSERGGIIYADTPRSVTLARELKEQGPLVTDVSVDVSTAGITTTLKLDLYTANFGKLHKHNEKNLSQISREKQKSLDEKNALIRKSMGKNQKTARYNSIHEQISNDLKRLESLLQSVQNATGQPNANLNATVRQQHLTGKEISANNSQTMTKKGVDISVQKTGGISDASSAFNTQLEAARSFYNTAGGSLGEIFSPLSLEPDHPNMPSAPEVFIKSRDEKLYPKLDDADTDDLTFYED